MWRLWTWFSGRLGSIRLIVGLDDLNGLLSSLHPDQGIRYSGRHWVPESTLEQKLRALALRSSWRGKHMGSNPSKLYSKYLAQLGAQLGDNWFSVPCCAIRQIREGKLDHSLYLLYALVSEQLWTRKPFSIKCQQHSQGLAHDRLCPPPIRFPSGLLTGTRQVKIGFPGQVVIACEDFGVFFFNSYNSSRK